MSSHASTCWLAGSRGEFSFGSLGFFGLSKRQTRSAARLKSLALTSPSIRSAYVHDHSSPVTSMSSPTSTLCSPAEEMHVDIEKSPHPAPDLKPQASSLVGWDGEDDPENPQNWTLRRKWAITTVVSLFTFMVRTLRSRSYRTTADWVAMTMWSVCRVPSRQHSSRQARTSLRLSLGFQSAS